MKYVLVAYDKSPSDALTVLGDELERLGHAVHRFLGGGKLAASAEDVTEVIDRSSKADTFVISGMSSKPESSKQEMVALETAEKLNLPFGIFSDSPLCWFGRTWFEQFRTRASLLFVSCPPEEDMAKQHYPAAEIQAVGNPSWEETVDPSKSRNFIFERIADPREGIVLVPFNKGHEGNLGLVGSMDHVLPALNLGRKNIHLVLAPHPGELKQDPGALEKYRQEIPKIFGRNSFLTYEFLPEGLASRDILRVAQLTVSAVSPTTDTMAALLRLPVVNYLGGSGTLDRVKMEFGTEMPPLHMLGAVAAITDLSDPFSLDLMELRRSQVAAFPDGVPKKGTSVAGMISTLDHLELMFST